jgi:hypothetical protein
MLAGHESPGKVKHNCKILSRYEVQNHKCSYLTKCPIHVSADIIWSTGSGSDESTIVHLVVYLEVVVVTGSSLWNHLSKKSCQPISLQLPLLDAILQLLNFGLHSTVFTGRELIESRNANSIADSRLIKTYWLFQTWPLSKKWRRSSLHIGYCGMFFSWGSFLGNFW